MKKNSILRILIILNNISWYLLWILLILFVPLIFIILHGSPANILSADALFSYFVLNYSGFSDIVIEFLLFLEFEILIGLALYITYNFKLLFRNIKSEKIFVPNNVKFIIHIAYTSIIITIIGFDLTDLPYALIFLLFAKIFEYGVQLENDKQLTI